MTFSLGTTGDVALPNGRPRCDPAGRDGAGPSAALPMAAGN
ncbi:MAG: hypothetical protein ABSG68_13885 [Thermoguttaceae bacterium]